MNYVLPVLILIFPGMVSGQGESNGNTGSQKNINFASLNLKTEFLQGSRWAIQQKKKGAKGKIEVFHAVELVDISKVDLDTMSIRIEIHMRQRWEADAIDIPDGLFKPDDPEDVYVQVDPKILESLWSPDSFIPIARQTQIAFFSVEQAVVNIFKNKTIIYKSRLFTILGCEFDFRWYPLDKQTCNLTIESYGTSDDLVIYRWETDQTAVVYQNVKLFQYDMTLPLPNGNGSSSRWARGEYYPYVYLTFEFERQLGHQLIQVFIPTTLVVILSWFSFWLGLDAIPGRISLLITCMLTLVTMHSGQKSAIPPVNYIKMMDIWMVGCMAFVFLALCEFVIVKYLHWQKQAELKAAEEKELKMKKCMEKVKLINEQNGIKQTFNNPYLDFYRNVRLGNTNDIGPNDGGDTYPRGRVAWDERQGGIGPLVPVGGGDFGLPSYPIHPNDESQRPHRPSWMTIDLISRLLFPLSFAVFNASFWPWLIIGAATQ